MFISNGSISIVQHELTTATLMK